MSTSLPQLKAFAGQRAFYKISAATFILLSLTFLDDLSFAQSGPPQEWLKKYGGSESEMLYSWVETGDGYLLGGSSGSGIGTHKTCPNHGKNDYWIIKLDNNGNKVWDKTFGGSSNDILKTIVKVQDNGFLLAGTSESSADGNKTALNKGYTDFWIVKISSNGSKLWDKTFGGRAYDDLVAAISTQDGGFLLGGNSNSSASEDKTENNRPCSAPFSLGYDYWIIKINGNGSRIFDKTFGGTGFNSRGEELLRGEDILTSIVETTDGGLLLGGHSDSEAGFEKSVDNACYYCQGEYPYGRPQDYWIIKLNADGIKQWDKVYGGSGDEFLWKVAKCPDGKYILMGTSGSAPPGEPEDGFYPPYIRAVLIDEQGNILHTIDQQLSTSEDDNWFTHLSAGADASGYYLLSQEYQHLEIVLEKYDWSGLLIWTKTIPVRTTEGSDGGYDTNSGFFEISQSGELFIGVSGYETTTDYWVYKFQSEEHPFSKLFYGGVDLNSAGPTTKVGDLYYQGDKFFPHFSYMGRLFANQALPLSPAPDPDKAKMIRSVVASSKTTPAVFNFYQVPLGIYEIYFYTWEDNYPTVFSIDIQDQRVLYNYNSGSKGSWAKEGPFKTIVSDGEIKIKASGGDANISGIEIWEVKYGVPSNFSKPIAGKVLNESESVSFSAYPNPLESKLTVIIPDIYNDKASITLVDYMGQIYLRQEKQYSGDKEFSIDLPSINPGLYYLKVQYGFKSVVKRLIKE